MAHQARPPPPRRATLLGAHPTTTASSMEASYEASDVIGTGSFGCVAVRARATFCRSLKRLLTATPTPA